MIEADIFRVFALFALLNAAALFPTAVVKQKRPRSAYFAVAGAELLMISTAAGILDHWGDPLLWYRTPLVLIAALLFLIFILYVLIVEGRPS